MSHSINVFERVEGVSVSKSRKLTTLNIANHTYLLQVYDRRLR